MRLTALYLTVCLCFALFVFMFGFSLSRGWSFIVPTIIYLIGAVFCWNWLHDPKKWD